MNRLALAITWVAFLRQYNTRPFLVNLKSYAHRPREKAEAIRKKGRFKPKVWNGLDFRPIFVYLDHELAAIQAEKPAAVPATIERFLQIAEGDSDE